MKEMILAGQRTTYPLGFIHPFACCGTISTNCMALGMPHSGRARHCHLLTSVPQHQHRNVSLQPSDTCTSMLHISVQIRNGRKQGSKNIHRQGTLLQ